MYNIVYLVMHVVYMYVYIYIFFLTADASNLSMGVLACSSLWVNVSSLTNGSIGMRLFVGQCQLLKLEC